MPGVIVVGHVGLGREVIHHRTDLLILSFHFFSAFPTREKMDQGWGGVGDKGKVLCPSSLEEPSLAEAFWNWEVSVCPQITLWAQGYWLGT